MKKPARILIVEHSATDADLGKRAIRKTLKRCEFQVVETRRDFLAALDTFQPDVILADYDLPRFDGMKVLKLALKHAPLTPVIIWTDCLNEELAVHCTKAGASNYLLKENLKRLGPIIVRALKERQVLLERRQAEAASRESEAKYHDLVETSHDLIWSVDVEGRFTFINRAVREIYGYEPEELLGRSFFDILDPQYSLKEWGKFREAIQRGKDLSDVETYVRHRDGRQLILSTNCIVMRDSEGQVLGLTGSSHEITIRKQIEDVLQQERNLLRTLIDNLPDRIYAMDRQGRKILSNTADWKASGGKTVEEVIGKTDFDPYASELATGYWRLDQSVLESGIPLINHEEVGLDEEGNRVSILTSKIPLRDDEGTVTGLVGIGRDITPRKEAEMERQVLLEIMQGLANTNDLLALLELIHHSIARVIHAENFFVVLYQPNTGLFEEIYSVDQYDVPEPPSRLEKSITSYVFRSGEPLLLNQARFSDLVAEGEVALVGTNSASWLGVPLKTAGTTIGVMAVQDYEQPNRYSERDKEFLTSIASQIALAIERKQADEELKKAEIKYRTLVERLPVVIYTAELGINGAWHYVSPQVEDLLGFTPEEWMADPGLWHRQMHPDDRERQEELEQRAYRRNEPLVEEYRIFARDGRQLWVQDSAQILPPVGDGPPIAQGILMDLTQRKQAEQEIRRQTETRIALYETTHDLVIERDLSRLLHVIVERATRLLNAAGGGLYLCEPEQGQVRCVVSYNTTRDFTGMTLKYGDGAAGLVAQTGEPLIIDDYSTWSGRAKAYDEEKIFDSVLSVPIQWQNQVIGVLHALGYGNNHRFSQDDLGLILSFANQAAIAIQNARLHSDLEQRNKVHVALQEATLPLIRELDLAEALQTIIEQAAQLLNIQHGYIYLVRPDNNEIELMTGMGELSRSIGKKLKPGEGVAGLVWQTAKPVIIPDYHVWHGRSPQFDELPFTAVISVPLTSGPRVTGVLGFASMESNHSYSHADLELLNHFAQLASIALENARLYTLSQQELAERKQMEQELRASEQRFIQLANNIQEVFWMTDAETGKEIYMSPGAATIWGRSTESMLHEPGAFLNSIFPEDRPLVLQAIEREKSGEKMEIEYRIVRPNGTLRWIWDRAFPVWDETGRVIQIAGISADITERRESELALVKSQSRYRELFDSSPISIWEEDFSLVKKQLNLLLKSGVTDLREYLSSHPEQLAELAALVQITDVNQAALALYQIEEKDALLKRLTQILSPDALSHFREEILGLFSPLRKFIWEGTDRMLNGRQMEVLVTGSVPHGYEEDWSKVIVSISDITERKHTEEEVRRRAEETSALLETSQALTSLDLQVTLETIANSSKNLFDADGCRIFLMEPNGESLRCVLTLQENFAAFSDLRIRVGEGVTGTVAATGQPEIVNDMQNDPRAMQVPGTPEKEMEAIMFAPLKERDRTIGVLSIRRVGRERNFQPADLELLEAFAAMAASAVSNARLFEETQRRLAELEALYENGLAVGRLLKVDQIGNRVIQTFALYLRWHHVTIRLKKEGTDELELVAFNRPGLKEEDRRSTEQHFSSLISKAGQGLSGWVIQTGIPFRTGNVYDHPQYVRTQPGIQSGLYMPLKVGERVIGVISVESEVPNAFTEQDERLLATLASQAAIAFENARLYEAVQKELSERKRAEEALRISEAHYRELADSITDILFELDQDLRYTYWNKASELFSGIPAEEAIGKSVQEVFGAFEEQGQRAEIYKGVLQEQQARTFEIEVLLKGQKRALEINAYPSRRGVSVVAKDITDRKRTETIMQKRVELMEYSAHHTLSELMQRTVDEVSEITGSTIGFFHFVAEDENQLGLQTWSTNALRLFSVPVREGAHLPLDQAGVWAEAVRQRRPLIQNDYESLARKMGLPRGHVPIVRELIIPILRNERIMAVLGIGNKPGDYTPYDLEVAGRLADYAWDITERKQMEVELAEERNQLARRVEERTADLSRANSNLARALRVKDEFLANMSHELRTPLNAILGLSESLGEQIAGPLNEKQLKYITTISESGHHLLALINDILDLAKIEAGQITLDINKMDIHSVCQASLRMVKQLAQKKNQEVSLAIEDGLGLMWADERRLKQMIVNLLGNAVKFTPEHGKIGLDVQGDQDANKITITVWDNGIGIKEHDLERLFQPFVQLDSGLARETTGTGLGLALVAQMARLHGGSVNAFSEPGVGSRFSIVLPWEPALALDSATRMRVTGKFRAIKVDETNKPTVLVVEDTKEVIMMIRDYLELAGYRIVTAQDGVDAIVQAKLVHPDLILMDVQMPRMDGLEATRRLRSEPAFKYTPIIALTALAMPNDRERCLAAGMDEYISKPVNLKALVKIIQSCLFNEEQRAQ